MASGEVCESHELLVFNHPTVCSVFTDKIFASEDLQEVCRHLNRLELSDSLSQFKRTFVSSQFGEISVYNVSLFG